MNALLLSAYDAASHQYWRHGLYQAFPNIHWTSLTLAPRYFSWRIRGNGLSWSQHPALDQDFDFCLATSMVDLATLRGLRAKLACVPTILYFHENQYAYPTTEEAHSKSLLEAKMVQLYSAMAADHLVFNSEYNRETFLTGVESLLKRFPDEVPEGIAALLGDKSCVVPVGVFQVEAATHDVKKRPRSIVWNHRWEYDKGPERLLAFLERLSPELPLTFHIVGQSFRHVPKAFDQIRSLLQSRGWMGEWGYVESRAAYEQLLERSEFVLSTAIHDFQGISVLEACALGCVPLLPDRLAYPEFFGPSYLYGSAASVEQEAVNMAEAFELMLEDQCLGVPDVSAWSWAKVSARYQRAFEYVIPCSKVR